MMSRHGVVRALNDRSWIVCELDVAVASSLFHTVVVLAVGLAGSIIHVCSALEVGAMVRLVDDVTPRLNQVFGRDILLPVIVALLDVWGGSLASKVDDEEDSGEGEDGDDADDDADDGGQGKALR